MRNLALVFLVLFACGCSCDYPSGGGGGGSARIEVSASALAFGPTWLGQELAEELTIENRDRVTANLRVSGIAREYVADPEVLAIPPGETATVRVSFRPTVAGVARARLALVDPAGRPEAEVALDGEGVRLDLGLPEALDFGLVELGRAATTTLTVANAAKLPVTTARLRIEGSQAAAFAAPSELDPLPAKGDTHVDVTFRPDSYGDATATLLFAACDGCPEARVALHAYVGTPLPVATPDALDFGIVDPGATRTLAFLVRNEGDGPVTFTGVALADPAFAVEGTVFPVTLVAGASMEVSVVFRPQEVGDRAAILDLVDLGGEAAVSVLVAGHGGGTELAVDPPVIHLGNVPLGWTGTRTVRVANVGEPLPVTVDAVRLEAGAGWSFTGPALPVDVGAAPAEFTLRFEATEEGIRSGELVLSTSDPQQPELRIPVTAAVIVDRDCVLEVVPAQLRFGLVQRGLRHVREVLLHSAGAGTCHVWDLGLAPGGAAAFSLESVSPTVELARGQRLPVRVAFAPVAGSTALERATLRFFSSDPDRPVGEVPISAWSGEVDVVSVPAPVAFGRVPVGYQPQKPFELRNRGATAVNLSAPRMGPGSSPELTIASQPSFPLTLAAGATLPFEASYRADVVGLDHATLLVTVAGWSEPVVVELTGETHDGPCSPWCDPPVPVCPPALEVQANHDVALPGSATDPTNDPVACRWQVISRPAGSVAAPVPEDTCASSFRPDLVGDYVLQLTAEDHLGNEASCTTPVRAIAPRTGLWVEMFWNESSDVDLHLLHPSAGNPGSRSSWERGPWDCFYGNRTPMWDGDGPDDDPALDRDDTHGTGPENIRIDQAATDHPYHVGIHLYRKLTSNPQVAVTTNVYCGGTLRATANTALSNLQFVFVGTVRFDGSGSCSWTPVGTVLPR